VVAADEDTLTQTDFAPFKALSDASMAMTAHVVYSAIDRDDPATLSSEVISRIIRGHMGFDSLLMTDDLSMKALSGSFQQRAERALAAGCDLLMHCNGERAEMVEIAHAAPRLEGRALERAEAALALRRAPQGFDFDAECARLSALFNEAGLEL